MANQENSSASTVPQHSQGPFRIQLKRGRVLIFPAEGVTHIAQIFAFYGIEKSGADARLFRAAAEMMSLLEECDEYLSPNPQNYIGHGSILHTKMRDIIAKVKGGAK